MQQKKTYINMNFFTHVPACQIVSRTLRLQKILWRHRSRLKLWLGNEKHIKFSILPFNFYLINRYTKYPRTWFARNGDVSSFSKCRIRSCKALFKLSSKDKFSGLLCGRPTVIDERYTGWRKYESKAPGIWRTSYTIFHPKNVTIDTISMHHLPTHKQPWL